MPGMLEPSAACAARPAVSGAGNARDVPPRFAAALLGPAFDTESPPPTEMPPPPPPPPPYPKNWYGSATSTQAPAVRQSTSPFWPAIARRTKNDTDGGPPKAGLVVT